MNVLVSSRWLPGTTRIIVLIGLIFSANAQTVTLEDFGYQNMKVNGHPALGARPLLTILLDLADTGTFAHDNAYYDNLVFNPFNTNAAGVRSVNGFMLVNSHARFSLARAGAGLLGPLSLPAEERTQAITNDIMRGGFALVAATRAGFDFAPFDENADGRITSDELILLIFDNLNQADSGAARWANTAGINGGEFTPPGSPVAFKMEVAQMTQRVSFATLCHELSHVLGTKDLYGIWNVTCHSLGYTLMSCTIRGADDMSSYGLDSWHKMQLGWVEPRIRSLATGGVETVTAAQSLEATDAPIILYNPARGPREFFLIEYRTRTSPWGSGYEDDLPSSGLGIWHVVHDANKNLMQWVGVGQSVWLEGQPNLQRGADADMLWTGNTTTPFLRWSDGTNITSTATRLWVRNFNPGDGSLTFEWLTASDTWVDFHYHGTESGSFAQPFNTLAEAVNAASRGGTVKFKQAGASAEILSISKPLYLQTLGGPVTIGR